MKTVSDKENLIWNTMESIANAQLVLAIGLFEVRIYHASGKEEE